MMLRHIAVILAAGYFITMALAADTHKDLRFPVDACAGISLTNPYGSVTVKPAAGNVVIVHATLHSDKAEVDSTQSTNRVDIHSHLLPGADATTGRVDYVVLIPAGASLTLLSTDAALAADGLSGDVSLEGAASTVDVRNFSDAHVHVKTMNGAVTLTNLRNGHVEVNTVSGPIELFTVTGPLVQIMTTSGTIHYFGDFGSAGQYQFTTHSGEIDATIPSTASADVVARSVRGVVVDDLHLTPLSHTPFDMHAGNAFAGTVGNAASEVSLRSFSGRIHLIKSPSK